MNADTGSFLPSLDNCNVSASAEFQQPKKLNVRNGRESGTPQP